jgi:NADPH2:quinone reductase
MRALRCHAFDQPETLSLETVPDPVPAAGEIVVQVSAAGVNFPDALMVMGQYQVRPSLPFTPGGEAAGVITAVASDVHENRCLRRACECTCVGRDPVA